MLNAFGDHHPGPRRISGIQIVFAGFVDHPELLMSGRFRVRDDVI